MSFVRRIIKFLFKWFVILVLLLMSAVLFILSYGNYKYVDELDKWMLVEGQVVSSRVVTFDRRRGKSHCPEISVEFEVAGRQQTSNLSLSQAPCSLTKIAAKKDATAYQIGQAIGIFVNPNDISETRVPIDSYGVWFYFSLVIGLILLGFSMFLMFVRPKHFVPSGKTVQS